MSTREPDNSGYSLIQAQADAWWVRMRSGKATQGDAQAFRRWCAQSPQHERAWQEVIRTWRALDPAAATVVQQDPRATDPGHVQQLTERIDRRRRGFIGGALAASVVGVMAVRPPMQLWPSVAELAADFHTGTGEQRELVLPNQVVVQMNTQTRINMRSAERGSHGFELLAGEAEVTTDGAPFTVLAAGGQLQTQSSRFNVRYTNAEVCVTCLEGEVLLDHPVRRQALPAGSQITYDPRRILKAAQTDTSNVMAWRTGSLSFVDAPLSEVIDEINRYRPGRVILRNDALARRKVRMRVSISQTDNALAMIRDLYGARLRELPGSIVLLS